MVFFFVQSSPEGGGSWLPGGEYSQGPGEEIFSVH